MSSSLTLHHAAGPAYICIYLGPLMRIFCVINPRLYDTCTFLCRCMQIEGCACQYLDDFVVCQERLLHDFTEDMELQVTEFYFNHYRCLAVCCSHSL